MIKESRRNGNWSTIRMDSTTTTVAVMGATFVAITVVTEGNADANGGCDKDNKNPSSTYY